MPTERKKNHKFMQRRAKKIRNLCLQRAKSHKSMRDVKINHKFMDTEGNKSLIREYRHLPPHIFVYAKGKKS